MDEQIEYEVLWNGVNDGHDSDLFSQDARVLEKRRGVHSGPRSAHERSKYCDQVFACLPDAREEALTFSELQVRTCLPRGRLNSALCTLKIQQRLSSVNVAIDRRHHGLRYWRRAA